MERPILGIHHVTAIATEPQRNLDFYAGTLGLRLVKRTVNFDDPGTYHLSTATRWARPAPRSPSSLGKACPRPARRSARPRSLSSPCPKAASSPGDRKAGRRRGHAALGG
jgi:catechol 2,3-dioxygenase-like lactoylglutathione lyase family enzyme